MIEVSIADYKGKNAKIFTGRDNGVIARKELKLEQKEKEGVIIIKIPNDTWGINPSFFGGLFESSIKVLGIDFFKQYSFSYVDGSEVNESLRKDIYDNFEYVWNGLE